jgi:hypothetical protein
MDREEAVMIFRNSVPSNQMSTEFSLQVRQDLPNVIESGYFDPILDQIIESAENRKVKLAEAANALALHYGRS